MVLEEWNPGDGQLVVPKLSTRMGVGLGEFRLALKLLLERAAVWVEGFGFEVEGCAVGCRV